jgi:hypothetical protein
MQLFASAVALLACITPLPTAGAVACGSPSCLKDGGCPIDNPAATVRGGLGVVPGGGGRPPPPRPPPPPSRSHWQLYGDAAYPWTATLPWGCVFSVADYPAPTPDAQFAAAQAAAVAAGGGVVFFPAGDYTFTADIPLASGVIIRGAPTTQPAKSGVYPGPLAPATRFHCPVAQHKAILNVDPGATGMGVVNIDSDGCAIMLWPGLNGWPAPSPLQPWDMKRYWADATNVTGMGSRKVRRLMGAGGGGGGSHAS